jgi:hypothetical protein
MERRVYLAQRLNRFRDCNRGERMVLVRNGPSLNQTNFAHIRGEICMGLNKIYLGFNRFHFYPRYYLAINRRVIEQGADKIQRLGCIRFLRDLEGHNPLPESALTYLLFSRPEQRFHENLCEGFLRALRSPSLLCRSPFSWAFRRW